MKHTKRKLSAILSAAMLCALCVAPAHALSYDISAPDDYLFGRSTSDDTIYEWDNPNVDRSKNTALIQPGFGTPSSYVLNTGEYFTPNLVPNALSGGLVNQTGSVGNPNGGISVDGNGFPTVSGGTSSIQTTAFTSVTSDLYYSNGSLGAIKIPSIGLTVGVYEGTDSAALAKGAGHFEGASIWNGNVAVAGHNRGVRNDFGKIHTLKSGDIITLTTRLGTRTYAVNGVTKVSVNDVSGLAPSAANMITLYTCVENQPAFRWYVTAVETV